MAQRRMVSPKIIDTDEFMDMPTSTQALYFHMLVRADDDGFLANPKRLIKLVGAAEDDFKVLVAKRFVVLFDTGVCVIRHWRVHNLIRGDRYHETMYTDEKSLLSVSDNGIYDDGNQMATNRIPNAAKRVPEVRLGKVSLGKDKIGFADNSNGNSRDIRQSDNVPTMSDHVRLEEQREYNGVHMTEREFDSLCARWPKSEVLSKCEDVADYCSRKGKRYKNYASAVRNFLKTAKVPEIVVTTAADRDRQAREAVERARIMDL